jgi:hypothetical protein
LPLKIRPEPNKNAQAHQTLPRADRPVRSLLGRIF